MKKENIFEVGLNILIAEAIGVVSFLIAGNVKEYYASLIQPPLSPPSWLFGVIWPIMYALMAIAFCLFYNQPNTNEMMNKTSVLYYLQLFVNFLWTIVFFRYHSMVGSLIIIIVLDLLVIFLLWIFFDNYKKSFYLLLPYMLWLLFATYLNIAFMILN